MHLKRERSRPQFGEAKGNINAVLVTPQKKLVWPPFSYTSKGQVRSQVFHS